MIINQTLHGYNKGHGLLASSLPLGPSENTSMLSAMSDWGGYRMPLDEPDGYITAYPLPDGKHYAFAKSWYADEMERPGCVWTHTFIIDLDDLDNSFDFRLLYGFFRRPTDNNYSIYERKIEILFNAKVGSEQVFAEFDKLSLLFLYTFLLSGNKQLNILIEKEQEAYINLTLLLLQYLPIGILKNTSISTASESPRKCGDQDFSLQFVSGGRCFSLQKAPWIGKVTEEDFNVGLKFVIGESEKINDELPSLMKTFSEDIGDSIDKFVGFANIMMLFDQTAEQPKDPSVYYDLLQVLVKYFPNDKGLLLKRNFLSKRLSNLFCTEWQCIEAICKLPSTDALPDRYIKTEERLSSLLSNDNGSYLKLLSDVSRLENPNNVACSVLIHGIEHLASDEVNSLVSNNWSTLRFIAGNNKYYFNTGWWTKLPKEQFEALLLVYTTFDFNDFNAWDNLLESCLNYGSIMTDDLAKLMYINAQSSTVRILNAANEGFVCTFLLNCCIRDLQGLLIWISGQKDISDSITRFIVFHINPEAFNLRNYKVSMWNCMIPKSYKPSYIEYYIFMYRLALTYGEPDSIRFIHASFDTIHYVLSKNELSPKLWNKIKKFTAKTNVLQEWDKCKKLRKGLAKYLKRMGFDKNIAYEVTDYPELAKDIIKEW